MTSSDEPASLRRDAAWDAVRGAVSSPGTTADPRLVTLLVYLVDVRAVETGGNPVSGVAWTWSDHGPRELTGVRAPAGPGSDAPELAAAAVSTVVTSYSASPFEDLVAAAAHTAPVVKYLAEGVPGDELDLWLASPVPDLSTPLDAWRDVVSRLPNVPDSPGVVEDLRHEHDELRPGRERATDPTIGDT